MSTLARDLPHLFRTGDDLNKDDGTDRARPDENLCQQDQRRSPPPSRTASSLRPRGRRRSNDVVRRIIINDMTGMPLATDIIGEQAPNIREAGEIAQKVAPSPGSAISFVTSAHHLTHLEAPNPRLGVLF
jgi:hypothetical protein